jgi:putative ABC transport system permease protein
MSVLLRLLPLVLRQLTRRPMRTALTAAGVAVATFLFVSVRAMESGVREATEARASDTTLIVYRANRFCPFTSQLPQHYVDRLRRIPGVANAVPMRIVVNNCRASLDVITFRGVPEESFAGEVMPSLRLTAGSLAEWARRSDAAMVGSALASRRGVRVGDRLSGAGIDVHVAGIVDSEEPQDRNVAYVHLPFLQEASRALVGGGEGGGAGAIVTQFNVSVDEPARLDEVAEAIDAEFARDSAPTSTKPERAFVARAAKDIVEVTGFARWLGLGALLAVFALVANAIALGMQERVRDIAILQTLGFGPGVVTTLVIVEGILLGAAGGLLGAGGAWIALRAGHFSLATEGVNIEFAATLGVFAVGWLAALAIGGFASVLPAWRAGRTDIVTSFRAA